MDYFEVRFLVSTYSEIFPVIFMQLILSLILLSSENKLCLISIILNFAEVCFVAQYMVYFGICSVGT